MYLMFGGACLKLKLMSLMTKVNMRVEDILLHAKNPINMLYFTLADAKSDMVRIFDSLSQPIKFYKDNQQIKMESFIYLYFYFID